MARDEDTNRPRGDPPPPWWSDDATEDAPLPDGFPERPDQAKVAALRAKLKAERARSGGHHRTRLHNRLERDAGRSTRDIGTYTLIPMMLLVGPAMGFLVGRYAEGRLGGEPWLGVGGLLFGMVAAVRQIVLMLGRKNRAPNEEGK